MDSARGEAASAVSAPSGPTQQRMPFLDVARAWALIGVVMINAGDMVLPADIRNNDQGMVASVAQFAVSTSFMGPSRALLAMMLGVGLVLMWKGAIRRGASPSGLLARRYVTLFLFFGVAHFLFVTDGDILAPFALAALMVIPLIPWLLGGSPWRPFVLAAAGALLGAVSTTFFEWWDGDLFPWSEAASTPFYVHNQGMLGVLGFSVGIWLTRLPEFTDANTSTVAVRSRALRLAGWGLVVAVVGRAADLLPLILFEVDPYSDPVSSYAGPMTLSITGHLVGHVGIALMYFGLIWWLVERARTTGRVLSAFAPMGRMTLTIYFGSTVGFLLLMTPFEGQITSSVQFVIGISYFLIMALLCSLWLRYFRFGPFEWLWRCLTYMRPLPIVRRSDGGE